MGNTKKPEGSTVRELIDEVARLKAEVSRCHERLEMDHAYKLEGDEFVRFEIPLPERSFSGDAIDCRDATIGEQDNEIRSLEATIATLTARIERLEADNARMLEALNPFVAEYQEWDFGSPDELVIWTATEGHMPTASALNLGHIRVAAHLFLELTSLSELENKP